MPILNRNPNLRLIRVSTAQLALIAATVEMMRARVISRPGDSIFETVLEVINTQQDADGPKDLAWVKEELEAIKDMASETVKEEDPDAEHGWTL